MFWIEVTLQCLIKHDATDCKKSSCGSEYYLLKNSIPSVTKQGRNTATNVGNTAVHFGIIVGMLATPIALNALTQSYSQPQQI